MKPTMLDKIGNKVFLSSSSSLVGHSDLQKEYKCTNHKYIEIRISDKETTMTSYNLQHKSFME